MKTGRYIVKEADGSETVRFETRNKEQYTKLDLAAQRAQFVKDAKAGKIICLSDLMITHGM